MENRWFKLAVVSFAGLIFSIVGLNVIQAMSGGNSNTHSGAVMVHGQQGSAVVQQHDQAFTGYPNPYYMGNMSQHFQMNQGQAEYNNMLPVMYYNMQMMKMQMQQMRQMVNQLHEQMKANMNGGGMSNMPMM